jgi:hypothetical protein
MEETWSDLVFPIEQLGLQDMERRNSTDSGTRGETAPGKIRPTRTQDLGVEVRSGKSKLYHCKGKLVDIYEPSQFEGARTRAN